MKDNNIVEYDFKSKLGKKGLEIVSIENSNYTIIMQDIMVLIEDGFINHTSHKDEEDVKELINLLKEKTFETNKWFVEISYNTKEKKYEGIVFFRKGIVGRKLRYEEMMELVKYSSILVEELLNVEVKKGD